MPQDVLLGLIGDNIAQSSAPRLHRLAGAQAGLTVRYDRLVPAEHGLPFDAVFDQSRAQGYRGLNITYPYKESVVSRVTIPDPAIRAIGAVNTVLFEPDGPVGWNTDYTGFIAAYRAARGAVPPGVACLIGAGGVGRALAFGLVALGATQLRLFDTDPDRARALVLDLSTVSHDTDLVIAQDVTEAAKGAEGVLNGTPVGMVGYDGTPLPEHCMPGAGWAFDAVYTPLDTRFLQLARAAGLETLSGYELFFHQGVDAWAHFVGTPLDQGRLRAALLAGEDTV